MAGPNDSQERTEDATPRKRQEARKKGTVARSVEVPGALVILAMSMVLPSALGRMGTEFMDALRAGFSALPTTLDGGSMSRFAWTLFRPGALGVAIIALTAMTVGLAANFAQVGFVLSAESMSPNLAELNPIEGIKRMLSARALVEGIKALLKAGLFGGIAWMTLQAHWSEIASLSAVSPLAASAAIGKMMHQVLVRIAVAWLALAALDYLFQRKQTDKQLRMSKDELKREMKDQEISPELKGQMFQRRKALAKGSVLKRVQNADVIITNPTHFAVALTYNRSEHHAPIVVAKGQDYLALKIREIATQHKVPIVPNPPLARELYKQCEVGDYVPRELFSAVAEVLAYVYRTLKKVRR